MKKQNFNGKDLGDLVDLGKTWEKRQGKIIFDVVTGLQNLSRFVKIRNQGQQKLSL